MIAVRAIPGGGKNFIATLISKHYHSNDMMYYDGIFNEYFHSPHLDMNVTGSIRQPFWNGKKWIIISSDQKNNPIIMHEHEWWDDKSGIVKKFNLYKQSSGKVGVNPEKFSKNITEGFFIFCNEKEELNFVLKLIHIKVNGFRPLIVYDEKNNCSTAQQSINGLNLRALTSLGKGNDARFTIELAEKKMPYKKWIYFWKKYCIFIKQFPYMHTFSYFSMNYITQWLENNMSWDLYNPDIFLYYLEIHRENVKKINFNSVSLQSEQNKLEEVRKLQKENNMILHEINYKDLFFDLKPTGTILDNYMDEIKEYTDRNMRLIEGYESFYGKIL